jgi:hypothetical protein
MDYGRRTAPGEETLLREAVKQAEIAIGAEVRRLIPNARVLSLGAIDLYPSCLAFWICVATDAQRDSLLADRAFPESMRRIVADCGYPQDSVDRRLHLGVGRDGRPGLERKLVSRHEVGDAYASGRAIQRMIHMAG